MNRSAFHDSLKEIFLIDTAFRDGGNFFSLSSVSDAENQNSTNSAFSRKWDDYKSSAEKERLFQMQKDWYLKLYGFDSEAAFANFLSNKKYILDAGCGLGNKAAWIAELAPQSTVIAMDFSESALIAAQNYSHIPNLFFIQGDIAKPLFKDNIIDYVNCDQVIMHTENPEKTFAELSRITSGKGEFACYFYARKALPRELLDDYFRVHCKEMSHDEIMEMSRQATELGKRLSALNVQIDVPEIPALGIKGGVMDIQRFIYWNFMKCYWNADLGQETSDIINFDWYSPSNARRYHRHEVEAILNDNNMNIVVFYTEEACFSGRFAKKTG